MSTEKSLRLEAMRRQLNRSIRLTEKSKDFAFDESHPPSQHFSPHDRWLSD